MNNSQAHHGPRIAKSPDAVGIAGLAADREGSAGTPVDQWAASDRRGTELARVSGTDYAEAQAAALALEHVRVAAQRDGGLFLRRLTDAETAAEDGGGEQCQG